MALQDISLPILGLHFSCFDFYNSYFSEYIMAQYFRGKNCETNLKCSHTYTRIHFMYFLIILFASRLLS